MATNCLYVQFVFSVVFSVVFSDCIDFFVVMGGEAAIMNTGVPRAALSSMAFWTNWFISATASTALSFQAAPSGETPTGNNVFRHPLEERLLPRL